MIFNKLKCMTNHNSMHYFRNSSLECQVKFCISTRYERFIEAKLDSHQCIKAIIDEETDMPNWNLSYLRGITADHINNVQSVYIFIVWKDYITQPHPKKLCVLLVNNN